MNIETKAIWQQDQIDLYFLHIKTSDLFFYTGHGFHSLSDLFFFYIS